MRFTDNFLRPFFRPLFPPNLFALESIGEDEAVLVRAAVAVGIARRSALLPGSPAIDATGACPAALHGTDQRAHPINYESIEHFSINDVIFRDGFQ